MASLYASKRQHLAKLKESKKVEIKPKQTETFSYVPKKKKTKK